VTVLATLIAPKGGDHDSKVWSLAQPGALPSELVSHVFKVQIGPNKAFPLQASVLSMVGVDFTFQQGMKVFRAQGVPFATVIGQHLPLVDIPKPEKPQLQAGRPVASS
jgi:hypothetical protein